MRAGEESSKRDCSVLHRACRLGWEGEGSGHPAAARCSPPPPHAYLPGPLTTTPFRLWQGATTPDVQSRDSLREAFTAFASFGLGSSPLPSKVGLGLRRAECVCELTLQR